MTSITMTRDDLLSNLQAKRAEAIASDQKARKEAEDTIPRAAAVARSYAEMYGKTGTPKRLGELRTALTKLANAENNLDRLKRYGTRRSSELSAFDAAIRAVQMSTNETFKISLSGRNDEFARLLNI